MIRRAVLLLCVCALLACDRKPVPARTPAKKTAAKAVAALPNLLDLSLGAAVVSRTAENNLEMSAVHAIDGLRDTAWSSSPAGPQQTLVYALASPARIERLGIAVGTKIHHNPAEVRFELSSDGVAWRHVLTLRGEKSTSGEIAPELAQYIRVTTGETKRYYATATAIEAFGRSEGTPTPRSFGGCWSLNFFPARLQQQGARITGTLQGRRVTVVDGGTDGVVARFMWMRGPMWGYAIATITPDGRAFSALTFHEEPRTQHAGEAWLGERTASCSDVVMPTPDLFLQRTGRWSMFGLRFDDRDALDVGGSRETLDTAAALIARSPGKSFRLVAHDFGSRDAGENLRRSEARAAAVGKALLARGIDASRIVAEGVGSARGDGEITAGVQRMLATRVDLELRP